MLTIKEDSSILGYVKITSFCSIQESEKPEWKHALNTYTQQKFWIQSFFKVWQDNSGGQMTLS